MDYRRRWITEVGRCKTEIRMRIRMAKDAIINQGLHTKDYSLGVQEEYLKKSKRMFGL